MKDSRTANGNRRKLKLEKAGNKKEKLKIVARETPSRKG